MNTVKYYAVTYINNVVFMKYLWSKILFAICFVPLCLAAEPEHMTAQITGKFDMIIPDDCGHQGPLIEFMRRFERIARRTSRITNNNSSKILTVQLNSRFAPEQYRFFNPSPELTVLEISADLRGLFNAPMTGRALTSALLQSRLGNNIAKTMPPGSQWIADGLWAEFVHRETLPFHILYFNYLPALRNLAENSFAIRLDQQQLTAPEFTNTRAPQWVLYIQRAQLMLKLADSFADKNRSNLLKDYLYLLANGKLEPAECFELTFVNAAVKQFEHNNVQAEKKQRSNDRIMKNKAMESAALKMLFSPAAPIAPAFIAREIKNLSKVNYRADRRQAMQQAELSDLPLLVQKYDSCAVLPKQKIREINHIIMIAPEQIRQELINLTRILAALDANQVNTASENIKYNLQQIKEKLAYLEKVDRQLQSFEYSLQTPLYQHRYSVGDITPQPPLPRRINAFIEQQQQSNNY